VSRDPTILELSTTQIAERLITLVDLMSAACDVLEVVAAQPRLLTCPDIRGSYRAAVGKLEELHPAHSREVAVDAVRVGPHRRRHAPRPPRPAGGGAPPPLQERHRLP
jgi:hypothetical protein